MTECSDCLGLGQRKGWTAKGQETLRGDENVGCGVGFTGVYIYQNSLMGASLVVQWSRIRLPMQETRVRGLVREDPTRHGVTKPVRHNY